MLYRSCGVFALLQHCKLYVGYIFSMKIKKFSPAFLENFNFIFIEVICLLLNLQFYTFPEKTTHCALCMFMGFF